MNDEMTSREQQQEYYESVNFAVDEIEERLSEDPDAEISELVWQEIDSSEYIMYYSKNLKVLNHSTSEPGEWKHLVADDDGYREVLQAMAYKTMEQDIWDEIRERDLD